MKEPITLRVRTTITDGDGKMVSDDSMERSNLTYRNLVTIQRHLGAAGASLQQEAEAKAGAKRK